MASRFPSYFKRLTVVAAMGLATVALGFAQQVQAQTVHFATPYQEDPATPNNQASKAQSSKPSSHGGEHFHATGRRPPPLGYQDVPSTEFQNGPDPDHQAQLRSNKDSVTGSNLGAFGNAYQDSNPIQSGQLGDSTGNGWVAPRGNGF